MNVISNERTYQSVLLEQQLDKLGLICLEKFILKMTMSDDIEGDQFGENVSLSSSAVCPDEGRFPTLTELQVGLGSGGKY